jgi:transposase
MPGPRHAEMARVEAAVLANPGMPARPLAKKLGVGKNTVLRARERLKSKRGENPVSEVPVEGEAVPQP